MTIDRLLALFLVGGLVGAGVTGISFSFARVLNAQTSYGCLVEVTFLDERALEGSPPDPVITTAPSLRMSDCGEAQTIARLAIEKGAILWPQTHQQVFIPASLIRRIRTVPVVE